VQRLQEGDDEAVRVGGTCAKCGIDLATPGLTVYEHIVGFRKVAPAPSNTVVRIEPTGNRLCSPCALGKQPLPWEQMSLPL
jgi:hypothetical protein